MTQKKYWLASNSPRRREMFAWLDWRYEASAANIDESRREGEPARDYVIRLAAEKAQHPIIGAAREDVIIAADTIVVLDEEILGKPKDEVHAFEMLSCLRGRDHKVMTAIAVQTGEPSTIQQDICVSCVHMRDYSDDEIKRYIVGGNPMDKAGGYAIQNQDFFPVVDFQGCYASVMGMPLCHLERILKSHIFYSDMDIATVCQNHLKYNCPITHRIFAGEDIG